MLFINANYWVSRCANKIWLNCLQLELHNRITIQKSNREIVYQVISTFKSNLTQSWRHNSAHLLSGLDLLCPAALHPFLSDLGFLPCFPHKLLACTRNNYIQSATILGIALNVTVCIFFFFFLQYPHKRQIMSDRRMNEYVKYIKTNCKQSQVTGSPFESI